MTEFSGAQRPYLSVGFMTQGSQQQIPGARISLFACKKSRPWQQLQPAGTGSRRELLFGQNRKPLEGKCGLASVNP